MAQKHILIAEDNKNTRLCLSLMLRGAGFKVSVAENGFEALQKLSECNTIDLLITDIKMPELNGIQVIKRLSSSEINLPIIVITGFGDKKMLIELIGLGIEDFLEKPFGNDELCKKVGEVFEKQTRIEESYKSPSACLSRKKNKMETDLRNSVAQKDFAIRYQPIIEIETNGVVGVEALIRWHHPEKGIMLPMDFIPLAEETGLIVPIGSWVLGKACQQIGSYVKEMMPKLPFMLGVNVSVKQLLQGETLREFRQIIQQSGIDPKCVNLEVTESMMMDKADIVLPVFEELRELGVRLVIDDFGTGYSCLSYLHRFPFDGLKIDRSFINKLGINGDKSIKIVQAIMTLASDLGMNVIAEGIENEFQLERLRELKCQWGQGFYFSKPLPPKQVRQLLSPSGKGIFMDKLKN